MALLRLAVNLAATSTRLLAAAADSMFLVTGVLPACLGLPAITCARRAAESWSNRRRIICSSFDCWAASFHAGSFEALDVEVALAVGGGLGADA